MRILIIDEDEVQANLWEATAVERGCEVVKLIRSNMSDYHVAISKLLDGNQLPFDGTILDIVFGEFDNRGGMKLWRQLTSSQKVRAGHLMVATGAQLPDIEKFVEEEKALVCFSDVEAVKVSNFCKLLRKICNTVGVPFRDEWTLVSGHLDSSKLKYQIDFLNRRVTDLSQLNVRMANLESKLDEIIKKILPNDLTDDDDEYDN